MTANRTAQLAELLRELPALRVEGDLSVNIRGIVDDSRLVQPGDIFVALRGQQFDGHRYIHDALAKGAAVLVCQDWPAVDVGQSTVVQVEDSHKALGHLASAFYGHPSRQLRLIGVTGTDGKTSTTFLAAEILRAAGNRVGHCTTVEVHDGRSARPNEVGFTTPQAMDLQRLLRDMVDAQAQAAVVEVSSHALATGRVEGCEFDMAVFTNLAPEHLDFHLTLEEYRRQKMRLFAALGGPRTKSWEPVGVINADDPSAPYFAASCTTPWDYGIEHPARVRAREVTLTPRGSRFLLETPEGVTPIETHLLGRFNVRNWLAATAAALACGARPEHVIAAARQVRPFPGRMEPLDAGQPFSLYVDFAHTPQGLTAALDTLRELHQGKTIAVFGHAGGRDTSHRRGLVEVARSRRSDGQARCDLFILTMDDPHLEDPAAILEEMRAAALDMGCREGEDFLSVPDRREAFAEAFRRAKPGDAVLLAGRGHERTIPLGSQKMPFHDATVARELLGTGREGPKRLG